jgi:hypothetical protein
MSPLGIMIMLHYYAYPSDFPDKSPAAERLIGQLITADMLTPKIGEAHRQITPKGIAYVDGLKNMPLPVQVWQVPAVSK